MQVSVIIPVYNAEKYLKECLNSVISQTFHDFEVIIVDDGSTDASGKICDEYAFKDKRIKVIHKKNEGLIRARKEGIQEAEGQYISFVDADDWVDDDFLETLICSIKGNQADIAIIECVREESGKSKILRNNIENGVYESKRIVDEIFPQMLHWSGFYQFGILPYMCNKIYRKDILLKCYEDIVDEIYDGEDVAVVYPYLLKCHRVVIASMAKYHYRIHEQAMTAKKKTDYYENVAKLYLYLCNEFKKSRYSDLLMMQLDQYMRKMIWQGSPESFIEAERHIFPFDKVPQGAKIVLYGAGNVGKEYNQQIKQLNYCEVVAWVDKNYNEDRLKKYEIKSPECLSSIEYEVVVIAVADDETKKVIKKYLSNCGTEEERIIC